MLPNFDFKMTIIKAKYILFSILLILSAIGCEEDNSASAESPILNIATAANVQFAMKDIVAAFQNKYKIEVNIILGSSGKLTAQIIQGAPYDLLISANIKYPLHLYQEKFAPNPPKIYALGSLVLWTMEETLQLDPELNFLNSNKVHKIAIANPKNAPYGTEALNTIEHYNLEEVINNKLVFAESIAQTNLYITTKNCEVGFTAKSVVLSPEMKEKGHWIEIPKSAYQPIAQGIIMTKYGDSKHQEIAQKFYNFMFSTEVQNILKQYGYSLPVDYFK